MNHISSRDVNTICFYLLS